MKQICFLLMVFVSIGLYGQSVTEFLFRNSTNYLITSGIDKNDVKEHPLGTEIAEKLVLLKDRYTYIQPAGPTSPVEKVIISKPVIYNSIQKLNRYYKKELKSGKIEIDTARTEFKLCLDIALIINSQDTRAFEEYLNKMDGPIEIFEAYKLVRLQ